MSKRARDRAEELFSNLQKRARDFAAAEEGLGRAVAQLIEEKGFSPPEVKRRLDEVVGRIQSNDVWERLRGSQAVEVLNGYRDEVERRVEETAQRFLNTFQIATKNDLKAVTDQITALKKKLDSLKKPSSKQAR